MQEHTYRETFEQRAQLRALAVSQLIARSGHQLAMLFTYYVALVITAATVVVLAAPLAWATLAWFVGGCAGVWFSGKEVAMFVLVEVPYMQIAERYWIPTDDLDTERHVH